MCLFHYVKQLLSSKAKRHGPTFVHRAKLSPLSSLLQTRHLHPNCQQLLACDIFWTLHSFLENVSHLGPKPCQGSCSYLNRDVIMGTYSNIHPSIQSPRPSNIPLYLDLSSLLSFLCLRENQCYRLSCANKWGTTGEEVEAQVSFAEPSGRI